MLKLKGSMKLSGTSLDYRCRVSRAVGEILKSVTASESSLFGGEVVGG